MKKDLIIPRHVAIIMDGNRRWAKAKGYAPMIGHKRGEERIEPVIDKAIDLGIGYLTFWAFSTENWNRSRREVNFLLNLYRNNLDRKVDSFHKKNVKINIIGNLSTFPEDIIKKTADWMDKTRNNTRIVVNIALSYGGRDEIIRAINKWHKKCKMQNEECKITKEEFEKYLDTINQPDPDLIIRTGGEQRLSGFLLWQSEYAELYFTDLFWPEFTPLEFENAVVEYGQRRRRFGK